ncbi:TSUP family transporter [Thiohalophilus sp.]|uniref:TSUP family transporter n=1 Tax=Thiohalophilus sp. TaxID=3028392 RepID=UPI002ACE88F1|nr:TSUP family transporter [Thiohalophilus sp.]MDZ7803244.1 TSUP family transporter [Thiohalophilus sp.]
MISRIDRGFCAGRNCPTMISSIPFELLLATCAILFAAYIFCGITGFGSGLIAIPLLALFLPLPFVVPYISFVDATASLVHGWRHRRHTDWREVLTVLPFTVLGFPVARQSAEKKSNTSTLANALGVFILSFAL